MLSNTLYRRIEWGDCDPAGIVFNPNYFSFFDHGTTMLYEAAGWPKQVMVRTFGILGCPVVETGARFMAPCRFGDEIAITSTVAAVRRSSFEIRHELSNGGTLCVQGREIRVWARKDPETGLPRAAPLPDEIVERFRSGG